MENDKDGIKEDRGFVETHGLNMPVGRNSDVLERERLIHELGERVKELNCMYGIANLMNAPDISFEDIMQGVIGLIPPAWQYPELTCACLSIDGKVFKTEYYMETPWRQSSDVFVRDEYVGRLDVCYLEERPARDEGAFLKEERSLINAITERIGKFVERLRLEREKAELELRNRQLQKAESLSRMAGAFAHHYNNLVALIMGNLELAQGKVPLDAAAVKYLNQAMKAAGDAAELNKLMLTYLGETYVKRLELDLSEVCRVTLPLFNGSVSGDKPVKADLPSSGPVIIANAEELKRMLGNLLTNAREAVGESGGEIRLAVRTVSQADIPAINRFPSGWRPKNLPYACLEVTDNGCGIPEKDIEKIFDPFFTSKFTGRGLGLPVALGIARANDGGITVKSNVGRGSVFSAFMPVAEKTVF